MDKKIKWNDYTLDGAAKLVSGRTPEREQKAYYAEAGTPWVKIENLNQGYITEAAEYLSELGREKVNLVPENSVLFSIVGTVGKVGIAGRELATNQQIVALIFDESLVLPLFGYYCLRYHADEIRKLSNQTTMALISRKTLGQYRISVPESLEEQRKIVEKLQKFETYGKKKEKLREKFADYERILFQKIFQNELFYHEKLALKEFIQESVSAGIAKNEEPSDKTLLLRSEEFEWPYLKEKFSVKRENAEKTNLPDKKYQLQEGDILIRNGCLILAEEQKTPRFADRSVLRIRTKNAQLLPEVLYGYLNLPKIRETLYAERKAGDNRKRPIRGSELERMEIPYFTMEKQKDYAACLKKIRKIQRSLDREISCAWKAFRKVLSLLLNPPKEEPQKEKLREELREENIREGNPQEGSLQEERQQETISHLVLAVLAGWCPQDGRTGEYCRKRQEIFRMAQPFFQPVALSFVTGSGQKEYLLERDFLTYHSGILCAAWENPLDFLKDLLEKQEEGKIRDAHLAFQGEEGIATEADWDKEVVDDMAREGLLLLAVHAGFASCAFLFR